MISCFLHLDTIDISVRCVGVFVLGNGERVTVDVMKQSLET